MSGSPFFLGGGAWKTLKICQGWANTQSAFHTMHCLLSSPMDKQGLSVSVGDLRDKMVGLQAVLNYVHSSKDGSYFII